MTDVGLNGAQITAAQGIVEAMAAGQLPRESAQALIEQLGIEPATVQKILGPTGFRPAAPE